MEVRVQDNFCSDCKYCEFIETSSKLRLRCKRQINTMSYEKNPHQFTKFVGEKRLSAKACLEFIAKE